jgi:TonB-linked SusC/RagA family outer membrane protein
MKRLLTILYLMLAVTGFTVAQRTVTGTVSGDDGDVLVGATVRVKGSNRGTVTDGKGVFTLAGVADGSVLTVAYTGYESQDVPLGASNAVNVVLKSGTVLGETVVTALGISRSDKAVGYAVTRVDGSTVSGSGEVNAIQGLAAKAAGIQVVGSSGTPGASSKILIRGNSSLQLNNQPLIVVDNVPYDNQVNTVIGSDYPFNANLQGVSESNRGLDINPDDIESISVLKGPAASALYGTRAANGVLLITTKKGKKGLDVSYGASVDISEVNKLPAIQTLYGQGNGGGAAIIENGVITGSRGAGNPAGGTPNNWGPSVAEPFDNFDQYFQRGVSQNHNLSVGGGNETTTFRVSYGNTSQEGIVPNTRLDRNSFSVNASTGIGKIKVNATARYTRTADLKAQNGSNLSGVMLALLRMPVDFDINGGSAANGYENIDGSQHTYVPFYDNPLWTAARNPNTSVVNRLTGSVGADYMATDWLTFTFRVGTDQYTDSRQQIFDIGNNNFDSRGELWLGSVRHEEVNTDFYATIKKYFGKFSTNVVVGSQLNTRDDRTQFSRGSNFAIPNFYNMSNTSILYTDNNLTQRRLAGVFATADFGYNDLVYLTIGGRNDWASTFGVDAKNSFFYPNASLSLIVSELLPANNIMTYAKVRGSYAQAGREPSPYSSRTYYTRPTLTDGFTDGNSFPFLGQNGFSISNTLGNSALRPEINTTYEGGIDMRFLNNRISTGFTYYYSKSTDLLVARPIASTSGFSNFNSNVGEMQNQGIEIEADATIINGKSFKWTLGGNFTRNRNEVLQLAPGVDEFSIESAFTGIGSYAIVGQPYGAVFGTQWLRNEAGQIIIGPNGLPRRDTEEGFLGNPYPDWTAAVRSGLSFKGLSLSGLLDIRQGGILWNGTYARMSRIGKTLESGEGREQFYVIEGVKDDGTPNDIRVSALQYFQTFKGDGAGSAVENAIEDGSWVRLREVTLSYTLPKFNKNVKGITIYATGRNLWLNTDYRGVDPETSLTGAGSNIGGFDYFNNPGSRSVIFGLRTNF